MGECREYDKTSQNSLPENKLIFMIPQKQEISMKCTKKPSQSYCCNHRWNKGKLSVWPLEIEIRHIVVTLSRAFKHSGEGIGGAATAAETRKFSSFCSE